MNQTADDSRAVWRRSQAKARERAEILERNHVRLRDSRARFVHARDELLRRLLESTCSVLEHSVIFKDADARSTLRARIVGACLVVEDDEEVLAHVDGAFERVVLWRLVSGLADVTDRDIQNADPILLAAMIIDAIKESR